MPLPRTIRLTAALLSSVLLLTLSPAHAEDTLRHKRDAVRDRIAQAESEMGEASRRLRRATAQLDAATRELATAQRELSTVRGELNAAIQDERRAKQQLSEARTELASVRARLATSQLMTTEKSEEVAASVVSTYKDGDPQLLAIASLLAANDPSDLVRRELASDAIVTKQEHSFDALRAAEVMLEVEEGQALDAAARVAAASRAASAAVALQRRLTIKARAAKRTTVSLVDRRRGARRQAATVRARDLAVLRRLEAKERAIRVEIRRAALRADRRGLHGSSSPEMGYLVRPVQGVVTSPFGYRVHPIYQYWGLHDGIDYGAPCGQPLIAAADGVVTSAYNSSVFGRRLFIRAGIAGGRSLTLIYNHAAGYRVGPGDRVRRGDVIGAVGDTGWSTGCHLHFTVLADGRAKDPEAWF